MPYSPAKDQIYHDEIHILYLDDAAGDRQNLELMVNKYNNSDSDQRLVKVTITTREDPDQIIAYLKDRGTEHVHVLICDQNLPGKWSGLSLMKWLQDEEFTSDDMIYVLYTGAATPVSETKQACDDKGILFFEKTGDFSTLIEKIIWKISGPQKVVVGDPNDKFYKKRSKEIIDFLKDKQTKDLSYKKQIASRLYSPAELIKQIEQRTPLGEEYVDNYYDGLTYLLNFRNASRKD